MGKHEKKAAKREAKKGRIIEAMQEAARPAAMAYDEGGYSGYAQTYAISYDGEKNLGEIGPIRRYNIDHDALRFRSWQMFLDSDVCLIVFQRYTRWVIGTGLKLQAEPVKSVLKGEGVDLEGEEFNNTTEGRFKVYSNSSMADYSGMENLHDIAATAVINAIVGGDVLVVLRLINGQVKTQLIDGAHVATPMGMAINGTDYVTADGVAIRHGIEVDSTGRHLAYHVKKGPLGMETDRIPARGGKSGALMAFMVYGLKYRLDNVRGIPLICAVMETAKKMERYKEATLASAEERAKIPYFIKHDLGSTGENPLARQLARIAGYGPGVDNPHTAEGNALADTVAASTNKMVINMPNGSEMQALESRNELNFPGFFTTNIDLVCATVEIPPSVAMLKHTGSFSASRAEMKDWEHTLSVKRKRIADQFYQKIYDLWLDTQVLSNKITAPGYLSALASGNLMAIAAYRYARWVGANVPHIDPLKEVNAERAKLGEGSKHLSLTTLEAATEALNGGDFKANSIQYAQELKEGDELGIEKTISAGSVPEKKRKKID